MQHSGVEVAAVGVPSGSSGEAVKIFVVKKNASLTEELITFCRRQLTGYKVPKLVEFRDELPKSNVGKERYYDENYVTKPVPKWTIRPELHANRPDAGLAGVFMAQTKETVLNYQMITTNDELASLCEVTRDFPAIATDTEICPYPDVLSQLGFDSDVRRQTRVAD